MSGGGVRREATSGGGFNVLWHKRNIIRLHSSLASHPGDWVAVRGVLVALGVAVGYYKG